MICKEGFGNSDVIATCCVCNGLFHSNESAQNCASTTATEIRVIKLKSKPLMVYRCENCAKNGGQNKLLVEAFMELKDEVNQLSSLKDTLEKISNITIPEMKQDISSLKSIHKNLKDEFDSHVENNALVIEDMKSQLSATVNNLSTADKADANSASLPTVAMQTQKVISELEDRKARKNNSIILNIPECPADSTADMKKSHDLNFVKDILKNINNLSTTFHNGNIKRIGQFKANACRIVKVSMDCRKDVAQVLIHWRLIPNKYIVSADLTSFQRGCLNSAKKEAKEFNLLHESDPNGPRKIVRFVKGNPTLIDMDKKQKYKHRSSKYAGSKSSDKSKSPVTSKND